MQLFTLRLCTRSYDPNILESLGAAKSPYEAGLARLRIARIDIRTGSREGATSALDPVVEVPTDVWQSHLLPRQQLQHSPIDKQQVSARALLLK